MLFPKEKALACSKCNQLLVPDGTAVAETGPAPTLKVIGVPAWRCPGCGEARLSSVATDFVERLSSHLGPSLRRALSDSTLTSQAQAQRGQFERIHSVTLDLTLPAPVEDTEVQVDSSIPLYERIPLSENPDRLDGMELPAVVSERLLDFVHGVSSGARIQKALGPKLGRDANRSILNLWGPPGTGKTSIARALAHALSRDLFVLNAAGLESSEVGETEKNIVRLFRAMREFDGVLLVDEADSLVDARTRASNGHEKALNQARNVLINELNRFEGVAIFASNLRENYDPALARRMEEIHVPPPDVSGLSAILRARLHEMKLDARVCGSWVALLVGRIVQHERTHGDPARPFTAADIQHVLLRAARSASRNRPDSGDRLVIKRAEIEAALQQQFVQLAAARTPDAGRVTREVLLAASTLLPELIANHTVRHTRASANRPSVDAKERDYRPAAEATLTEVLGENRLLIDELRRLAGLLKVVDLEELSHHLNGFVSVSSHPGAVPNLG